jgi:hypothetical protein
MGADIIQRMQMMLRDREHVEMISEGFLKESITREGYA